MNGSSKVSKATQQRVLEACARLDYVPNPAARALSTSRSRTVAAIIPTIEHSVFAKFIAAIEATLGDQGYTLVLAISNGDPEEELRGAQKLIGMGAEAFILTGEAHSPSLLEMFERRQVPHVFTSVWNPDNSSPTIGYDNALLAGDAVRYLAAHGHAHIGVVHGPLADSDRTKARRQGAETAGAGLVSLEFHETELNVRGGKSVISRVLAAGAPPSALLCFSDVIALGVYFGLAEAGKRIPQDMSVMGFDNLDWAVETVPPLTTIDLPAAEMGRAAARQIIENLEDGTKLQPQFLPAQIIERGSVLTV